MPRRDRKIQKREVEADPVYDSKLVTRLINKIMEEGKKMTAERIVYDSFDIIGNMTDEDPMIIFDNAIKNVRPRLEVRPRRVGGATFQVPMEVDKERSIALAGNTRWKKDLPMNCWTLLIIRVGLLKNVRACTRWRRQTGLLPTTAGNY